MAALVVATCAGAAWGHVIVVDPGPQGTDSTIAIGISLAAPGDTVLVYPGVFEESVTLRHDITLMSLSGPDVTTIRGGVAVTGSESVDATVRGFRLEPASGYSVLGSHGPRSYLLDNVFAGSVAVDGPAHLEGNLFVDPGSPYAMLSVWPGFEGTIRRNIFYRTGSATHPLVNLDADVGDSLSCNVFWDRGFIGGDYPMETNENGNVRANPRFCDPHAGDFHLSVASPCAPGQHPMAIDCGRVGPYDVACGTDLPFYAYASVPATASYREPIVVTVFGHGFPSTSTFGIQRQGSATVWVPAPSVAPDSIRGTLHVEGQPPGEWDLVVTDGYAMQVLAGHFRISRMTVDVTRDTIPSAAENVPVTIRGGPFLPGVNVELLDPTDAAVPLAVTIVTADSITIAVSPGGRRGEADMIVTNPNDDTLTIPGALWLEDRNRELRFPADFATLQLAIDTSIDGDTITVAAGVHTDTHGVVREKNLLIRGEGTGESIIESDQPVAALSLLDVDERTLVTGLTFRNINAWGYGGAIHGYGACRIVGNTFRDNRTIYAEPCMEGYPYSPTCYYGEGAGIRFTGAAEIRGNVFIGNVAGEGAGAVHVEPLLTPDPGDTVRIVDNVFIDNVSHRLNESGLYGYTLHAGGVHVVVDGNTFVSEPHSGDRSIEIAGSASAAFTHNIVVAEDGYHGFGYVLVCSTPTTVDCNALDSATLVLAASSDCEIGTLFEVDPAFCGDDYTISVYSPIHPDSTACGRIGALGVACAVTPIGDDWASGVAPVPATFRLGRPAPNPFNPRIRVPFAVPAPGGPVRIQVFGPTGRRVRTLVEEPVAPGPHVAVWDGTTDRGVRVASGVYFVRMHAPGYERSRMVTLLR